MEPGQSNLLSKAVQHQFRTPPGLKQTRKISSKDPKQWLFADFACDHPLTRTDKSTLKVMFNDGQITCRRVALPMSTPSPLTRPLATHSRTRTSFPACMRCRLRIQPLTCWAPALTPELQETGLDIPPAGDSITCSSWTGQHEKGCESHACPHHLLT